jgi:hypothetical protein
MIKAEVEQPIPGINGEFSPHLLVLEALPLEIAARRELALGTEPDPEESEEHQAVHREMAEDNPDVIGSLENLVIARRGLHAAAAKMSEAYQEVLEIKSEISRAAHEIADSSSQDPSQRTFEIPVGKYDNQPGSLGGR